MHRISVSSVELEEVFCRVLAELSRARAERRRQRLFQLVTVAATVIGVAAASLPLFLR